MARKKNEDLTFIPAEENNPAILGKLQGPCADFIHPTRNGRKYSKDLWKKVFNDEIVKETFANGGVMGELGHPEDRSEIDMEKVAIIMPEPPKENDKGELIATFDILNTPNGRILKTLVDYGYKIGISSRGTGDVYSDGDGTEVVDEDTYDFVCFDAVVLPAVKSARLSPVTEALKKDKLHKALNEEYSKATEEEKRVMKETLEKLELDEGIESAHIETEDQIIKIEVEDKDTQIETFEEISNLPIEGNDIDELEISDTEIEDEKEDAEDFGLDEVVENLQKSLRKSHDLEKKVEELQTQLSVSNAKELKLNEEVERYKQSTQRLSEKVRSIKALNEKISQLEEQVQRQNKKITKLQEKLIDSSNESNNLTETIAARDAQIRDLKKSLKHSSEVSEQYSNKLDRAKELVEKYKKAAQIASDRYIDSQARAHGLTKDQVSARLSESFTLKEVDEICESLSSHNLRVNKLPFDLSKNVRMTATSKDESILGGKNFDDDVDESLLRLANL